MLEQKEQIRIPLKNRKLLNVTTTMLRNTAASKAAIGPLNTSDKEIVTVLNPQAELTAANAKIKRL